MLTDVCERESRLVRHGNWPLATTASQLLRLIDV